jgi:hypothetical protein
MIQSRPYTGSGGQVCVPKAAWKLPAAKRQEQLRGGISRTATSVRYQTDNAPQHLANYISLCRNGCN